jgi:hypothetical protein
MPPLVQIEAILKSEILAGKLKAGITFPQREKHITH